VQEKLFSDNKLTERAHDSLTEEYTTAEVASRIWHQHVRPRLKLLFLSSLAMIVSAATTGAVPLLIQRATDDIFINKDSAMVLVICFAVIVVTTLKTLIGERDVFKCDFTFTQFKGFGVAFFSQSWFVVNDAKNTAFSGDTIQDCRLQGGPAFQGLIDQHGRGHEGCELAEGDVSLNAVGAGIIDNKRKP
jgi:anaerobic C4-dicarboxylate transporter